MVRSAILTALLACNARAFVAPSRALTHARGIHTRAAATRLAPSRRADRRAPTMAARVPWRTVFLAEYGGPIAIFPAVAAAASTGPCRALDLATGRAGNGRELPDFKGSSLGRSPLVSADVWTSDHLSEWSGSVDAFLGTRALERR